MSNSSPPRRPDTSNNKAKHFRLLLLPGLHGNAELFDDLIHHIHQLEVSAQFTLITYPTNLPQSYNQLFSWLCSYLALDDSAHPPEPKTVIIAESFSTTLAIKLAKKLPHIIDAVIIGGGFCSSPVNPGLALLPLRPLFMVSPPTLAIRHFLTGSDSSAKLNTKVRAAIQKNSSKNLSQRVRSILTIEENQTPSIPNIPTLLIQAEYDALIPSEVQNQLEQHLPHATSLWLDAPHLIFQAQPATSASHIKAFLDTI